MTKSYIIIRNFISPEKADSLGEEYIKYCYDVEESIDSYVPFSYGTYGYISFYELLCDKLPEIQEITGEILFPTYTYSRVYKKNAILPMHKDRQDCEVSLTVHLASDHDWNFVLQDGDVERNINLKPGDALLYNGVDFNHGRPTEYEGEYYAQVFLHYIKAFGKHSAPYNAYLEKYKQVNKEAPIAPRNKDSDK